MTRIKTEGLSLGLDWKGERARVSADLYSAEDRVDGVTRGISLGAGVAIPKPPKADTQLSPSWGHVENKDKGFIVRGEYDLSNAVTAYAAYGQSNTEYLYNGASGGTITNSTGDYTTNIAQLAFEVDKKSADVGVKGKFNTGSIGHQWVANATYHKQDLEEFGTRITTTIANNIYNPVWTGTEIPLQNLIAITNTNLEQKALAWQIL